MSGIDVDELGPGNIDGRFVQVEANGNAEQGVDLNENNEGDMIVTMNQLVANDNSEEGVEFEEDDDFEDFPAEACGGDLKVTLVNMTADRNGANDGDAGLKVREKFDGDLAARLVNPTARENEIGGIQVREGEAGASTRRSSARCRSRTTARGSRCARVAAERSTPASRAPSARRTTAPA